MDMVSALQATRRNDLVEVWAERRAAAVPVIRAALEAEGIPVTTRGMALLSLLQAFAAYAPAHILVRAADEERAKAVLAHLFLGEKAPERAADVAAVSPVGAPPPTVRSRAIALGAAAAVALGGFGLSKVPSPAPDGPAYRPKIEVVLVDDESDIFANLSDVSLAEGMILRTETAPIGREYGSPQQKRARFAAIDMRPGESLESIIARGQAWAKTLKVPPGERIVWEPISEYEPDTGHEKITGARTFLVKGDPILTEADIVDAMQAMDDRSGIPDVYVSITLNDEAARRFEEATGANVNRRIAIIVDGQVNSAPVVKTKIGGGRMSITMAQGDPDKQLAEARRLVRGLRAR